MSPYTDDGPECVEKDPKPEATPAFVEPLEPTEEMPKESDKTEEPEDNEGSDHVANDNKGGVFFKE